MHFSIRTERVELVHSHMALGGALIFNLKGEQLALNQAWLSKFSCRPNYFLAALGGDIGL